LSHSIACTRLCEPYFLFFPDTDELEWYIPAGINLPDLQLPLAVIEQFEKSPLDLNGKRASQLLQKRRRRRRRRRQPSNSDSDSEGGNNSDSDAPRKGKSARERETYKSAQFIEDSEGEYERDIDAFFAREAELRKRTALSAASVLVADASAAAAADGQQEQWHRHLGTMRATGTKKRRRAQPARGTSAAPRARAAKRRAVVSLSGTPGMDGEGEHGGINAAAAPRRSPSSAASFDDDDDDDDGGGGDGGAQRSSIADRDAGRHRHSDSLEAPKPHRPRARPLYRRGTSLRASPAPDATPSTPGRGTDGGEDEDDDAIGPRPSASSLRVADEDHLTRQTKGSGGGGGGGGGGGANTDGGGSGGGSGLRKGRLIISDEEE